MKPCHSFLPYSLLALAWVAYAVFVWWSAAYLPERVATHFGPHGEPNDWQTHAGYVRFSLIFGAAVPAFILGIFSLARLGDGGLMNIPRREYWLAPERRAETLAFVQRQGAWFASMLVVFFGVIHGLVLMANTQSPVILTPGYAYSAAGILICLLVILIVSFVRHFYRKPI